MSELHKLILDALDQLGSMSRDELEKACFIEKRQRGGFNHSLNRLFAQRLVNGGTHTIWILPAGVHAIEEHNIAKYRKFGNGEI